MKKLLCILLMSCMLLPMLSEIAVASGYDPVVKIGLYYDSAALPAANLQNVSGMDQGYAFGYYDEDRVFVSTYENDEEHQITVLKNTNLWLSGSTYSDAPLANYDDIVGAYCLQIDEYFDLDDALDVIEEIEDEDYDAYLCYTSGGFRVRIGQYTSGDAAAEAREEVESDIGWPLERRVPNDTCYTVVITGTSEIIYQFDMLGDYPLGIQPLSEQTWFKGYKYYGGFEYNRVSGNNINVINVVGLTDYIKGVLPYEVSVSWPMDALKAQALCAKCYTIKNLGKHSAKGFDLCNTTDCQMYCGTNKATEVSDTAVEETEGLFVLYDGEICTTYYHASSGGYTEDAGNIWGKDIPYLKSVQNADTTVSDWTYSMSPGDILNALVNAGYTEITSNVSSIKINALGEGSEYVSSLTFTDILGHELTINGSNAIKKAFGYKLPSSAFVVGKAGETVEREVYKEGQVVKESTLLEGVYGEFIFVGRGNGNGLGLSVQGAKDDVSAGMSYTEIIKKYYRDVTVKKLS